MIQRRPDSNVKDGKCNSERLAEALVIDSNDERMKTSARSRLLGALSCLLNQSATRLFRTCRLWQPQQLLRLLHKSSSPTHCQLRQKRKRKGNTEVSGFLVLSVSCRVVWLSSSFQGQALRKLWPKGTTPAYGKGGFHSFVNALFCSCRGTEPRGKL